MWISVKERLPIGSRKRPGGVSADVLVSVECDNGVRFVGIDRYDPYSGSWEQHHGDDPEYNGQNVTHWMPLPMTAT